MVANIPLSSKLAAIAASGYAVRQNRDPHYYFGWHMHDCAMLLWPQMGALDTRWMMELDRPPQSQRLVRHSALLLPPAAAHGTRSLSSRQHHGELYLRTELLGPSCNYGVLRLDGAAVAMLDALTASALSLASAEHLVHAIMKQLTSRDAVHPLPEATPPVQALSQQLLEQYRQALDSELPLPSVDFVAARLGVSMRRLQRACDSELGMSPVAVRRHMLALKARELLADGTPLPRVSQQLGFAHSGHLNRLLKAIRA